MTDWCTTMEPAPWIADKVKYKKASAAECIRVGNDLIMPGSKKDVDEIVSAVKDGTRITRADLQYCAGHVINTILHCYM